MKAIKSALAGLQGKLSEIPMPRLPSLPTLGREVEIPVYVIHNSEDAEDYFFIFDFEEFVGRSREGMFVRPKLKLWAGRDDFDRTGFARQFRQSFAKEFEAARVQLATQKAGGGWFGWLTGLGNDIVGGPLALFVANVVLLVGLSAGRMVLSQILPAALTRTKSDAAKLEDSIEETKQKVDAALHEIEIVLHIELYRHAYRGQAPGRLVGMDHDAWPLPDFVLAHLNDNQSASWW